MGDTLLIAIMIIAIIIIIIAIYVKKNPSMESIIMKAFKNKFNQLTGNSKLPDKSISSKTTTVPAASSVKPAPAAVVVAPPPPPGPTNEEKLQQERNARSFKIMGAVVAGEIATTIVLKVLKKKFAARIGTAAVKLASKTITKLGLKLGIKGLQRIGVKIAQKAAVKIATKVGAGVTSKLTMSASLGPVGIVTMALSAVTIGLDIADVGGYMKMGTLEMYEAIRKDVHESFKKSYTDEGLEFPVIYGPLDILEKDEEKFTAEQTKIVEMIMSDPNEPLIQPFNAAIMNFIKKNPDNTEDELNIFIDSNIEKFIDMDKVIAKATQLMCVNNNGKMLDNGSCSYKTAAECKASMTWPPTDDTEDTYVEWDPEQNACAVASSALFTMCKENGLDYDWDSKMCKIDENYCLSKGAKWIYNDKIKKHDCAIPLEQEIFENLFGTTVTRGIIQIFAEDQYCPCPEGTKNVPPLLCESCPEDRPDRIGALCYEKCPEGMEASGFGCRKTCPSGKFRQDPLTCAKNTQIASKDPCPAGMRDDGTSCWRDTYGNGVGTIPVLNACPANSWSNGFGDCIANVVDREDGVNGAEAWGKSWDKSDGCSWNRHIEGGMCFRKCPNGYFGRAHERCAANGADSTGVMRRSWQRGSYCPDGKINIDGLCYNPCKSGYHNVGGALCAPDGGAGIKVNLFDRQKCPDGYRNVLGVCWPNCPDGFKDNGVWCDRPGFERAPFPLKTIVKKRKIAFSTKDGNQMQTLTGNC